MHHPKLAIWERNLELVIAELDDLLEDTYGKHYQLHPARRTRGKTVNKAHDGLFNIAASFSMGYGSKYGKGYVIDIHMSTLENVPKEIKDEIDNKVVQFLGERLPQYFPGKNLQVNKDGTVIKIHGDLKLGSV